MGKKRVLKSHPFDPIAAAAANTTWMHSQYEWSELLPAALTQRLRYPPSIMARPSRTRLIVLSRRARGLPDFGGNA